MKKKYHNMDKRISIHSCIINKKSLKIPKGNQKPYIEEEQTNQWPKLLYFKPESAQI
jgi:hypothetical protein